MSTTPLLGRSGRSGARTSKSRESEASGVPNSRHKRMSALPVPTFAAGRVHPRKSTDGNEFGTRGDRLDLAGSKVAGGVVDGSGAIVQRLAIHTAGARTHQEVLDTVLVIVAGLQRQYAVHGVGIGVAGLVD